MQRASASRGRKIVDLGMSEFLAAVKKPREGNRSSAFTERVLEEQHVSTEVADMVLPAFFFKVRNFYQCEQVFVLLEVIQQSLFGIVSPVSVFQSFISSTPAVSGAETIGAATYAI